MTAAARLGMRTRESPCAPHFMPNVPLALMEYAQAALFFIAYRLPEVMPDNEAVKKCRRLPLLAAFGGT